MSESVLVTIDEPTDIAQARRLATRMATSLGFDEILTGEIAIVVTEAGTNMLKHADRGDMLLRIASEGPGEDLEMLALDRGPGMQLDRCLTDGYTTGSSPGQGLGAIRRLATVADFYSAAGAGTVLLARWPGPNARADDHSPLQLGAVNVPKTGP
jgi:anti-sigma regulatory factor (Ser/Thr protein kinase)